MCENLLCSAFDEHDFLRQINVDFFAFSCWFGLFFAFIDESFIALIKQGEVLKLVVDDVIGAFQRSIGTVFLNSSDDSHGFLFFLEVDFLF